MVSGTMARARAKERAKDSSREELPTNQPQQFPWHQAYRQPQVSFRQKVTFQASFLLWQVGFHLSAYNQVSSRPKVMPQVNSLRSVMRPRYRSTRPWFQQPTGQSLKSLRRRYNYEWPSICTWLVNPLPLPFTGRLNGGMSLALPTFQIYLVFTGIHWLPTSTKTSELGTLVTRKQQKACSREQPRSIKASQGGTSRV